MSEPGMLHVHYVATKRVEIGITENKYCFHCRNQTLHSRVRYETDDKASSVGWYEAYYTWECGICKADHTEFPRM